LSSVASAAFAFAMSSSYCLPAYQFTSFFACPSIHHSALSPDPA
jgi:hypothetical protein